MYKSFGKRIIDVSVSLITLVVLSPVFIVTFLILFVRNNSNVFFLQLRPGKNEKLFKIIKFKTMNDLKDIEGNLLPDSKRITVFGNILRSLSVDELPQLINVLKGDMSIIGPRPLSINYIPIYTKEQHRRHLVKPGITGWAQVNGRNRLTWKQKFDYDLWYVDNLSLSLDIKIIFLTIKTIVFRKGIYKGKNIESMDAFNGLN